MSDSQLTALSPTAELSLEHQHSSPFSVPAVPVYPLLKQFAAHSSQLGRHWAVEGAAQARRGRAWGNLILHPGDDHVVLPGSVGDLVRYGPWRNCVSIAAVIYSAGRTEGVRDVFEWTARSEEKFARHKVCGGEARGRG